MHPPCRELRSGERRCGESIIGLNNLEFIYVLYTFYMEFIDGCLLVLHTATL